MACSKCSYNTFLKMNKKCADQTEEMRRLVKLSDLLPTQDTVLSGQALAYMYIEAYNSYHDLYFCTTLLPIFIQLTNRIPVNSM